MRGRTPRVALPAKKNEIGLLSTFQLSSYSLSYPACPAWVGRETGMHGIYAGPGIIPGKHDTFAKYYAYIRMIIMYALNASFRQTCWNRWKHWILY